MTPSSTFPRNIFSFGQQFVSAHKVFFPLSTKNLSGHYQSCCVKTYVSEYSELFRIFRIFCVISERQIVIDTSTPPPVQDVRGLTFIAARDWRICGFWKPQSRPGTDVRGPRRRKIPTQFIRNVRVLRMRNASESGARQEGSARPRLENIAMMALPTLISWAITVLFNSLPDKFHPNVVPHS